MGFVGNLPSILINTLTIVNLILIMQLILGLDLCRKWQQYFVIAGSFFLVNIGIIFVFPEYEWAQAASIYIAFIAVVCLLAKKKWWRYLLQSIPAIALYVQWGCVLEMVDKLFSLERFDIEKNGILMGPFGILADVILIIPLSIWASYVYRTGRRVLLNIWEIFVLCLFCFLSPQLVHYLEQLQEVFDDFYYPIIWISFSIIINVALFCGILHRSSARYYRETVEIYKEQFHSEYDYFKAYKEQQKENARFHHDWKNHTMLIQRMLEDGEYDRATEYFRSLTKEKITNGKRVLSGNEIVDIILSTKQEKIEELEIEVTCNGGLEKLSFMEDVDICVLFSNIIDNAIEANAKCKGERFLSIGASHNLSILMIAVSNRMSGGVSADEGGLITTKKDKKTHGIGTQNIFAVVRKYHGETSIQAEDGKFRITMTFPIDHLSQE